MNVAIINYGLGNVTSVAGAIEALDARPILTAEFAQLERADCLVLPGVGAFGDGMTRLRERGLVDALDTLVRNGKPLLGICLGAQLLCAASEEFGRHAGLGWIDAEVRRLKPRDETLRVPHVGWNEILQSRTSPLWDGIPSDALFYFTHSYGIAADSDCVIGTCDYGHQFAAALQRNNIFGIQPHPEKSQRHGLALLKNFLRYAECYASA